MIYAIVIVFSTIILSTSSYELSTSSLSQSELQPSDYDLSLDTKQKLPRNLSTGEEEEDEGDAEVGEEGEETKEGAYFREYVYRSPASVTTTKKPVTRHKFAEKGSEFHDNDYEEKRNGYSPDSATDVRSHGDKGDTEQVRAPKGRKKKRKRMYTSSKKSVFNVPIPPKVHSSSYDDNEGSYIRQKGERSSSTITPSGEVCPCLKNLKQKSKNFESKKSYLYSTASHDPRHSSRPTSKTSSSRRAEKSSRREPVYYSVYEIFDDEVNLPPRSQSSFQSDGGGSNEEGTNLHIDDSRLSGKGVKGQKLGWEGKDKASIKQLPRWKSSARQAIVINYPDLRPIKLHKGKVTSIQDILADVQSVL